HRKLQLNKLNELHDQAYENSLIYKERTTKLRDSKIKNHIFNVGDRVLLFNSSLKIFSGKLKTRWSGPFTITQVFPYRTIELSQLDGPNFKVNGHRVKHYFGGDIPPKVSAILSLDHSVEIPSGESKVHIEVLSVLRGNRLLSLVGSQPMWQLGKRIAVERKRTCPCLFQFSLRDQASNWLERLPAGSITTWEDLTTRFLAQLFPPGRTAKLHNDILMFQQHHGESLSEAWTHFKDLLQKVPHHGIDLWLQDLALYDNKSWNDPRDFAKPVKAITLTQDVLSTFDCRLIELENQVQRLMRAHLAPTQPTQVKKVTTLCEICSGPHDTQYCMEDPEQAFVEYASSRIDEAGGKWYTLKPEQNNLGDTYNRSWRSHPKHSLQRPEVEIKPQQPEEPEPTLEDEFQDLHLNLLVLEVLAHTPIYNAILDKYLESLELGKNGSAFVQGKVPENMEDPELFTLPCRLGDSKPFDTLDDLGSCVNIISLYLFKNLNIGLLEETDHIFRLADGTKSYPVGIVKDVEINIGKLKLLNNF
ncbi:MAK10-like protein, partial [Tanacetum coccineum]